MLPSTNGLSRTICRSSQWDFLFFFSCACNNHNCFIAQHLETHLASLLENKLASVFMNQGLTLHWTAGAVSLFDRPVFLDSQKEAGKPFSSGMSAHVSEQPESTHYKLDICPRTWSQR